MHFNIKKFMKFMIIILIFFLSSGAYSKTYRANGDIMGQTCSWGKCKSDRLDFVITEYGDGLIHKKIKREYHSTEIHDVNEGVCWIVYKKRSSGFVYPVTYFDYYMRGFGHQYSNGSYKLIKPKYVWFKCTLI